jgi:nitroreductase
MKIENAIKQRRSIRQYNTKVPDRTSIEKVLGAGSWAPSGLNNQPWKFKVVKGKALKDGLATFTKYGKIIKNAPVAIAVFLDNGATYNREKDIMSVGACIQNMLLQAHALGLGTCWLGEILNKKEQVEKYLQVDTDYELMAVVCMGYSEEKITKGSRRRLKSFVLD